MKDKKKLTFFGYLKYLKGAWVSVVLAPLLMVLEVVSELYQPSIMAKIVDDGIMGGLGTQYIVTQGIKMIGISFLGVMGGIGCGIFATHASLKFGHNLRKDVYSRIQDFSFANIDHFSSASLVTRLTNDVVMLQMIVAMALRMFVRSPMIFIVGISRAVMINRSLALILVVVIPLIVLVLVKILGKTFPMFGVIQEKLDRVNAVIQENLTGIRVVKAYDRSGFESERFDNANNDYVKISVRAQRMLAAMMPLITLIMNVSVIAVLYFGSILVGNGSLQVGEVSAFVTYITRILMSIMFMSMMFNMLSRAAASGKRIGEIMDADIDITSPDKPVYDEVKRGEVEFRDVSFRYIGAGGEPALRHITFDVKPGETVAILGSTGCGKSTLVNLIPRLYDATEGEVLVDGINVKEYDIETLRKSVGMVLQDVILFSGTIRENLRWGKSDATDEEIAAAAEMAQAAEFINANPDGYDAMLGQRGVNFSGGQKQRLSIARALIKKPKILILDDATSAVDTATEAKIRSAIAKDLHDTTLFIIAQRISSAKDADKIIVMENGEIVDIGNHDSLMKSSAVYQEIYYSQIEKEDEANG